MNKFEFMLSRMSGENPYCVIKTGDLNCRSTNWWADVIESEEGKLFESPIPDLALHQLISEPTHFNGNSRSCIDVISTDQPNLFLLEHCHHHIFFGKLSVTNLSPASYNAKFGIMIKGKCDSKKSIEMFPWSDTFSEVICPNTQVKNLNEILLNIFSNFIPNKTYHGQVSPGTLVNTVNQICFTEEE